METTNDNIDNLIHDIIFKRQIKELDMDTDCGFKFSRSSFLCMQCEHYSHCKDW